MFSSRFSIITRYPFWPAPAVLRESAAVKSIQPDRPGSPIQTKSNAVLIRNSVAGRTGRTVRLAEGQLVELVRHKCVEVTSKTPSYPASGESIVVRVCVVRRARGCGCSRQRRGRALGN